MKARTVVGRGGQSLFSGPGTEVRLERRRKKEGEDSGRDGKKMENTFNNACSSH